MSLKHLAFDLLAAPASSAADERVFSMAGRTLDDEHYNTMDDLAEAYQSLQSVYVEGIEFEPSEQRRRQQGVYSLTAMLGDLPDEPTIPSQSQ